MRYLIDYAFFSHQGKIRKMNQDNVICGGLFLPAVHGSMEAVRSLKAVTDQPCFMGVFDGMGGEERGEMASFIAAETATEWDWHAGEVSLQTFCQEANQRICRFAENNGLEQTGTTAAMLLFQNTSVIACNLGDSRIFFLREGRLMQISTDHVFALYGKGKGPLTQFLGIPEEETRLMPAIWKGEVQSGDLFLVCSDGLTDMVSVEEIEASMQGGKTDVSVQNLTVRALENGGKDNISLILARVTDVGETEGLQSEED